MAAFTLVDSEDVWVKDLTGGIGVGDNGLPLKREGGVSGDRAYRSNLEDLCGGGKLSAQAKRGAS